MERWAVGPEQTLEVTQDELDGSLHSVTENHRRPPTPITPGTERLTLQEAKEEG